MPENPRKAAALLLVGALILMVAFATSYVGAFHDPTPRQLPVALVGTAAQAQQLNALDGKPLDVRAVARSRGRAAPARRPRGLRRLRREREPPVRRVGGQPRGGDGARADRQPHAGGPGAAGGAGAGRQAAGRERPERHVAVLRRDRVGVRRLLRGRAARDGRRQPQLLAQPGGAARGRARRVRRGRQPAHAARRAGRLRRARRPVPRAVGGGCADRVRHRRGVQWAAGAGRDGRHRARDPAVRHPRQPGRRRRLRAAAAARLLGHGRRPAPARRGRRPGPQRAVLRRRARARPDRRAARVGAARRGSSRSGAAAATTSREQAEIEAAAAAAAA